MPYILVVDDSPTVRAAVSGMLVRSGFAVQAVGSGREALRRIQRECPCLVVLDIVMSDGDGLETICQLKKLGGGVKILAISGGIFIPPTNYLKMACSLGAHAALAKPFTEVQLLEKVRELLPGKKGLPPTAPPFQGQQPNAAQWNP